MKICLETFGCRLNKAEALQREADYVAKGWQVTTRHSDADLIIVRGCSVTKRAEQECEKLITHLRGKYPTKQILVEGCLKSKSNVPAEPETSTAIPTRTARAYLKVQDGCSGKCTFCIVPQFRGKSVSTPWTEVLDRARRFIESGYHEIVVTGCNLALYAAAGKRLPELVAALAELSPTCRIRLGSLEPGACAMETVNAMAEHSNICRFLHLPIQSGSNRILTTMRRPYFIHDVDELARHALRRLPHLALGCDLMTGFPGETDLDHSASVGLLQRFQFSNAHVFPYSERPGTLACAFPRVVPPNLRSVRAHELSTIARAQRKKFASKFLGQTVEIIVEHQDRISGWTSEYLPCEARGSAPRKSLVRIKILQTLGDRLVGQLDEAQSGS